MTVPPQRGVIEEYRQKIKILGVALPVFGGAFPLKFVSGVSARPFQRAEDRAFASLVRKPEMSAPTQLSQFGWRRRMTQMGHQSALGPARPDGSIAPIADAGARARKLAVL